DTAQCVSLAPPYSTIDSMSTSLARYERADSLGSDIVISPVPELSDEDEKAADTALVTTAYRYKKATIIVATCVVGLVAGVTIAAFASSGGKDAGVGAGFADQDPWTPMTTAPIFAYATNDGNRTTHN
ncbi:hypothetical protein SDRG_10057, partial [Saprolegnia diclina VS20]